MVINARESALKFLSAMLLLTLVGLILVLVVELESLFGGVVVVGPPLLLFVVGVRILIP